MIEAGMLPRFIETPTTKAKPKPKPTEKFVRCRVMPSNPQHVSARRFPENSVSWDLQPPLLLVPQTHGCMFRSHKDRTYTSILTRRARRQHSGTSEASGVEHGVHDGWGLQLERDRILDGRPQSTSQCKATKSLSTRTRPLR